MPKRGKAMVNWGRRKRRRCRWEALIYLNQIKMPQRGLRSSLPGTEHESVNKKGLQLYAIFFASVWCIKGNSCKFLHEKDGVGCTCQVAKEDWATSGDFIDCKVSENLSLWNFVLKISWRKTCQ
ncbi:unnamed protein product [Musa acuminata subsp. burmannicoides]